MAKARKAAPTSKPAEVPVEVVVPALPVNAPTTFGGPNSGNIGWNNLPAPKPLTSGDAPFTLDPKKG